FVVAWTERFPFDGDDSGILARRFASDGSPVGADFVVNSYTVGSQQNPDVGVAENGTFVIVWEDTYGRYGVFGQRFDTTGGPVGSEFQVSTYTAGDQANAAVAIRSPGGFIVAWDSSQDGDDRGVFAQRFTAAASKVGTEFQVNTYTPAAQQQPDVS